jgi:hypothetical protein
VLVDMRSEHSATMSGCIVMGGPAGTSSATTPCVAPISAIKDKKCKALFTNCCPGSFVEDGQGALASHWHGNKVCYAQWMDVGPFRNDSVQYVFGARDHYQIAMTRPRLPVAWFHRHYRLEVLRGSRGLPGDHG